MASSVNLKPRPLYASAATCLICQGSCQLAVLWTGAQPSNWIEDKVTRKQLYRYLLDSSASHSKPIRSKLLKHHKNCVAPGWGRVTTTNFPPVATTAAPTCQNSLMGSHVSYVSTSACHVLEINTLMARTLVKPTQPLAIRTNIIQERQAHTTSQRIFFIKSPLHKES